LFLVRLLMPSVARVEVWKAAVGCSLILHVSAIAAVYAAWPAAADRAQFDGRNQVVQIEWTPAEIENVSEVQWQSISPPEISPSLSASPQITLSATDTNLARTKIAETQDKLNGAKTAAFAGPSQRANGSGLARRKPIVDPIESKASVDFVSPLAKRPTTAIPLTATSSPFGSNETLPADFSLNPPPEYPAIAVRQRLEGDVLLEVHVGRDGSVNRVTVLRSSGYLVLDRAAVEAVRAWTGRPAMRAGEAIEKIERLPIQFRLL